MKVVYIANDGKQFETEEECLDYEDKATAREVFEKIKIICKKNTCSSCPFHGKDVICVFDSTEMPDNFFNEVGWD